MLGIYNEIISNIYLGEIQDIHFYSLKNTEVLLFLNSGFFFFFFSPLVNIKRFLFTVLLLYQFPLTYFYSWSALLLSRSESETWLI